MDSRPLFTFPRWSNKAAVAVLLVLVVLPLYVGLLLAYGANPTTLNVGYAPVQPVPYSHAMHVGSWASIAAIATRRWRGPAWPPCLPPRCA